MTLDVRFVANNPAAVVGTYPWINYVLDVFKKNGYKMTMGEVPITSMVDLKKYYAQVAQTPNRTQAGIIFCGDSVYPQD